MLSMNLVGTVRLLPKSHQSDHLTNTALLAVLHCILPSEHDCQQCNRVPNAIALKTEVEK
jgi:hypothetical protein